jgi:hypothetical protein
MSLPKNPQYEIILVYLKSDVGKTEKAGGCKKYERSLSYTSFLFFVSGVLVVAWQF